MVESVPFWKHTPMAEMTPKEWESLCDGCGLCCLVRLEDEDSGEIALTNVACRFLDFTTCRCTDYANRQKNVPDCEKITPETIGSLTWLPETCGYRLVYLGNDLPDWHPLISGDPESVHKAGISKRDILVSEDDVDDYEDHVVEWEK